MVLIGAFLIAFASVSDCKLPEFQQNGWVSWLLKATRDRIHTEPYTCILVETGSSVAYALNPILMWAVNETAS